jgi:hypothetical protein
MRVKMENNLFNNQGVEIKIIEPGNFLKIKETLTRIGIASRKDQTLYQSCHILHKKDKTTNESRYAIMHFKELFVLDGKKNNITDEDLGRRNTIVNLLEEWKLLEVIDFDKVEEPILPISKLKIISFKDKDNWNLESKYTVGTKKGN